MSFGRQLRTGLFALLVAVVGVGQAAAQDANATVSGTVADEQGQVLPGATVTLTNETTKLARTGATDARGDFRFTNVLPGTYSVKVELQGFKAFERRNNVVNSAAALSLETVKLGLGALSEVIVVEDSGSKVNTEETQHSGLLTSTQIEQLQSKGRDIANLLRAIPGVRYGEDTEALGDSFGTDIPNVSGQRNHWNKVSVDGMNATESGGGNKIGSAVSLDAIAEVKVLLNSYRAEYGGTGGSNIQIVSKSGGTDYRGTAYWLGRRTGFNANRWENNKELPADAVCEGEARDPGCRPQYDYNTWGFNFGGPMPGQDEKKLFFFYNLEVPLVSRDGALMRYMLPTEAERQGNFSQSFPLNNPTGRVTVLDPITGVQFPNNIIPANRIDPNMQLLMNRYPLPNRLDTNETKGAYNFLSQRLNTNPRQNHMLRFDWKPSEKDTLYISGRMHRSLQKGVDVPAAPAKWGFYEPVYDFGDAGVSFGHTRIFSANLINEFSAGGRRQWEKFAADSDADLQRLTREGVGYTLGQFFPGTNTSSLYGVPMVPQITVNNMTTTGVTSPSMNYPDRIGENAKDYLITARDTLTWTKGVHTFKGGVLFERWWQNEAPGGGSWMGTFTYDNANRTTNPVSSTVPYANFLLGAFRNYAEISEKRDTANRQSRLEWYVQDTWKISRRLTLDIGSRFLWYQHWHQGGPRLHSGFVPERYSLASAPRQYITGTGGAAVDPLNLNDRRSPSASFVGRFVPGSGDPGTGMVLSNDSTYPSGYRDNQGIHPEPRIGLAFDLFGNGKTALHTGFGLAHQGYMGGGYQGNLRGVPASISMELPNNTIQNFLGATGFQGPTTVNGIQRNAKTPSAYTTSLGVTQEVGWGTTIDVTYVGVFNRHMDMVRNLNLIPNGAQLANVTTVQTDVRTINTINPVAGGKLQDNMLRPYLGFADIRVHEHWATGNYNALQAQLTRRYTKGLQFSAAYTFSKALGYANSDSDGGTVDWTASIPLDRYYGPVQHNQTHNFVFNFTYDVPKLSKVLGDAGPVRFLLDNWQFSGEYAYATGDWVGIDLDLNPNVNLTGGSNCTMGGGESSACDGGATVIVLRDPRIKGGSPTDPNKPWIDATAFAMPTADNLGNASRAIIQRPPINVLNMSVFKNFPLGGRKKVQARVEGYNVLNHTQIRDVGRTIQFQSNPASPQYGQITNLDTIGLATNTTARPPRILQVSLRFSF
jgi:hypothetical protein